MFSRRLLLVALVVSGAADAQSSLFEVTDAQIAKYKTDAYEGCREPGIKRGDAEPRVNAFCSCVIATLEKSMKPVEWQQATFYALKNDEVRHRSVIDPYRANLKSCAAQPK